MTTNIPERRSLRTALMNWVYDKTDGRLREIVDPSDFLAERAAAGAPVSEDQVEAAIDYLEGQRLLKTLRTMGVLPSVELEHAGLVEIEDAREHPDRPTSHLGPMVNIMTIHGNVTGAQLQQGSPGAYQSGTISVQQRDQISNFIAAARQAAQHPGLDPDDRTKVLSDVEFMERELAKPQPQWDRLKAVGLGIKTILLSGLGQALGTGIAALPWHEVINSTF